MPKSIFRHSLVALVLLVSMAGQATSLAGTTGALSGDVLDTQTNAAIANAVVTVSSPSQNAQATTDATGRFTFLSLAPDTYTISAQKQGYDTVSQAGLTVIADQTRTLMLRTQKALKEIGRVSSRSAGDLVKPGTTSDVYSVTAATAEKASVLGGGGNINNAYSGVSAVPGAYVPQGQQGYGQGVFIRGGDYDQVGYEYDGVPVNRSFDQYAGGSLSNLGQQELQVYTGGAPASSSASAISGFINQVIRTGTYPGFGTLNGGIGSPTFYHKLTAEVGGATPNRLFSYFFAGGGYNQSFRLWDQNNGPAIDPAIGYLTVINNPNNTAFNVNSYQGAGNVPTGVVGQCVAGLSPYTTGAVKPAGMNGDPGCYSFAPGYYFNGASAQTDAGGVGFSNLAGRDFIANLHFGIPHRRDAGKDDIQLLYSASALFSTVYSSQNDIGLSNAFNAYGPPAHNPQCTNATGTVLLCNTTLDYIDPNAFPLGTAFGTPATGLKTAPYLQPGSPQQRAPNALIPPNLRDGFTNNQDIVKVQYQKNFGSSAYARLYGYTFYSDWLITGNNYNGAFFATAFNPNGGNGEGNIGPPVGNSPDYELSTHTRGAELQLVDQINAHHLLNFTANYTTASTKRVNNTSLFADAGTNSRATSDTDGINCFNISGGIAPCNRGVPGNKAPWNTLGRYSNPTPWVPVNGSWIVTNNLPRATYNAVMPKFASFALTDQFKPNDKLLINLGLRYERFEFDLPTTSDNGKDFWFNAARKEFCYDSQTLAPLQIPLFGRPFPAYNPANGSFDCVQAAAAVLGINNPNLVHPDGLNGHRLLSNAYDHTLTNNVFSPRLAATYTVDPYTVLRASYGKYSQPISSAFTQYNTLQPNLATFLFNTFWKYGFTSPRHDVVPSVSDNYDFSLEHNFRNTDVSVKLTPFYRSTRDQVQQFFLDPTTGFVSGLNVGHQTSYGVEFQLQKGDFNKNGLSGLLSYTYTNSKIRYNDFRSAPGRNVIDVLNDGVVSYNKFTKFCDPNVNPGNATSAICGGSAAHPAVLAASPCYQANSGAENQLGGAPASPGCLNATDIVNPYYNDPLQPLFDRNGSYYPFDIFPAISEVGLPGGTVNSFHVPHVFTAIVNWRKDKLAITPSIQFNVGNRYGAPLDTPGIDPTTCTNNQVGVPTAPNPKLPDYTTCFGNLTVPNPENGGRFVSLGQFVNPSQLSVNATVTYDLSAKVRGALTFGNIVNRCFGGSATPWRSAFSDSHVCSYGANGFAPSPIATHGGFYNGAGPNDLAANGVPLNPYLAHSYQPLTFLQPFNMFLNFTLKI